MSIDNELKGVAKREDCPEFDEGYCHFYKFDCYHVNREEKRIPSDDSRCNRLVPLTEDELMDWMDPMLCSDCNEPVCNDCDQYINYKAYKESSS